MKVILQVKKIVPKVSNRIYKNPKKITKLKIDKLIIFAVLNVRLPISIIIRLVYVQFRDLKEELNYLLRAVEFVDVKVVLKKIENILVIKKMEKNNDFIEKDQLILQIHEDHILITLERIQAMLIIFNIPKLYKEFYSKTKYMHLNQEQESQNEQSHIYQVEIQVTHINNKIQLLIARPVLF